MFCLSKIIVTKHTNEYRANMHWDVACITARTDVYAMMMGSRTDGQKRQPRLHRRGKRSASIKKRWLQYHIMSNPPALVLRGQTPTSYLASESSSTPTPGTTVSPVQNENFTSWSGHNSRVPFDRYFLHSLDYIIGSKVGIWFLTPQRVCTYSEFLNLR